MSSLRTSALAGSVKKPLPKKGENSSKNWNTVIIDVWESVKQWKALMKKYRVVLLCHVTGRLYKGPWYFIAPKAITALHLYRHAIDGELWDIETK